MHKTTAEGEILSCGQKEIGKMFTKTDHKRTTSGLAAVVNRVTCSVPVPGSTLYVHACHPRGALPAPGLAGCPVGRGE